MRAGELRHRFALLEPSETVVSGDATVNETNKGFVWGSMRGLAGREKELHAEADYEIKIRHRPGISSRWQLGLGTRRFKMTAPPLDLTGLRRELIMFVTEILA